MTGTVLHASKKSTQNWIVAIYSALTRRKGVIAMQLSKELGVQHKTAWYMLHYIREACDGGRRVSYEALTADNEESSEVVALA